MARPTTLYRYFDRRGVLLYVGITTAKHARASQHWRSAPWWPFVATATFKHYRSLAQAEAAEAEAIWNEMPLYNHRGAGRGSVWLPMALAALGEWRARWPQCGAIRHDDLVPIVRLHPTVIADLLDRRRLPHRRVGRHRLIAVWRAEEVIEGLTTGKPAR